MASAATKPKGIAAALLEFQRNAPEIHKDATNPHFKSKFVTLKSVLAEVRPLLNEHGIVVTQIPSYDKDTGQPILQTRLIHAESGESIDAAMLLFAQKQDPQGQGSAITYARRYSLVSMLGLEADDDDGNAGSAKAKSTNGRSQTITARRPQPTEDAVNPAQRRMLFAKAKEAGLGESDLKAILLIVDPDGHGHSDRLPKSKLDTVLDQIKAIGNGAAA